MRKHFRHKMTKIDFFPKWKEESPVFNTWNIWDSGSVSSCLELE